GDVLCELVQVSSFKLVFHKGLSLGGIVGKRIQLLATGYLLERVIKPLTVLGDILEQCVVRIEYQADAHVSLRSQGSWLSDSWRQPWRSLGRKLHRLVGISPGSPLPHPSKRWRCWRVDFGVAEEGGWRSVAGSLRLRPGLP